MSSYLLKYCDPYRACDRSGEFWWPQSHRPLHLHPTITTWMRPLHDLPFVEKQFACLNELLNKPSISWWFGASWRSYRWLSAKLQDLQCVSNGYAAVLHQAIDMSNDPGKLAGHRWMVGLSICNMSHERCFGFCGNANPTANYHNTLLQRKSMLSSLFALFESITCEHASGLSSFVFLWLCHCLATLYYDVIK